MSRKQRGIIALCISFLVTSLLLLWVTYIIKSRGYYKERIRSILEKMERCILENDHKELHELLQDEANRKYFYGNSVEIAMERGHLEVVQEISGCKDTIDAINRQGVERAVENGHAHIVKYILSNCSLQNIIFKDQSLLRAISDNDKLMKECITEEVISGLLGNKNDVVECVMGNKVFKKRISAWIIDYLMKSQDVERIRSWNPLAWRAFDKGDIKKLIGMFAIEKLVNIMECPGVAEVFGRESLRSMLSTEHGRELLKRAFIEGEHRKLRDVVMMSIKSVRCVYVNLMTFLLRMEEESQDGDVQFSYEGICDLRADSIRSKGEKMVIERLSNIPELDNRDIISVYRQILFQRKICSEREEFRNLPQSMVEKLHKCFSGEEAETDVELVARRLTKKDEQVPLSTHELYMVYGESKGRYLKSDGLIRNCLYDNHCAICRKPLVEEKPYDEEDVEIPVCPVCKNDYDTGAECSKVEYKALACGHVYHNCCLEDWMESVEFDNECPYESCQKPVLTDLSEEDVIQIGRDNKIKQYASVIKKEADETFSNMMRDPKIRQPLLCDIFQFNANRVEVERLLRLVILKAILESYKVHLDYAKIYIEVERMAGFSASNLTTLRRRYPWFMV